MSARGARRRGSKTAAATQYLSFSEMTLVQSHGRWTLTEAQSIELFSGLRDDLEKLSLGAYFAELLEAVADEDNPNPEILGLGLNALFALSEGKKPLLLVKAAFEMRLMCLAGFEPMLSCCAVCGNREPDHPSLSAAGGTLCCSACKQKTMGTKLPLCPGSLAALRHITGCDSKRIFSFAVGQATLLQLSEISELYALTQLDRGFQTLDFYKSVRSPLDTCSEDMGDCNESV